MGVIKYSMGVSQKNKKTARMFVETSEIKEYLEKYSGPDEYIADVGLDVGDTFYEIAIIKHYKIQSTASKLIEIK